MNKKVYSTSKLALTFIGCIVFMMGQFNASAQVQGPNYGLSTIVKTGQASTWQNASSACVADNRYASVSLGSGSASDTMEIDNFHFNVPANAQIEGITITINKGAYGEGITDNMIKLTYNGAICGSNHAIMDEWPANVQNFTYGGNDDQWGINLTPEVINSYSFGIAFSVSNSAFSTNVGKANIDYVNISVTYKTGHDNMAYTFNTSSK